MTSGRRRASAPKSLRTARGSSSTGGACSASPSSPRMLSTAVAEQLGDSRPDLLRRIGIDRADRLAHHFDDRPEGDPLAVVQAATVQPSRPLPRERQELAHEAGLADAGRAEHGDQLAATVADGALEGLHDKRELPVPANHGGIEVPDTTGRVWAQADQTPGTGWDPRGVTG